VSNSYLSGVYPLLDEVEEGEVDSGAEDRQEAVEPVNQRDNPMAPQEAAQAGEGAAPGIDGKARYKWLTRRSDKRSLYWWQYLLYLKTHPLPYPKPKMVHSYVQRIFFRKNRMPRTESPKIGQVRVCGGSGRATARFYPAGGDE
jgi:hypothetical protein